MNNEKLESIVTDLRDLNADMVWQTKAVADAEQVVEDTVRSIDALHRELRAIRNPERVVLLSTCCNYELDADYDICNKCYEHTGAHDGAGVNYEFKVNQWVKSVDQNENN